MNSNEITPLTLKALTVLMVTLVLAAVVRIGAIEGSQVIAPLRADATDYYFYALNLKECGTYSRQDWTGDTGCPTQIKADSQRSPGYPLFLTFFVDFPPSNAMIKRIQYAQLVLGVFTVFLTFLLFRPILGNWPSIGAAAMVAISPHLAASGVYVLTETLFTFLLLAWLWASMHLLRSGHSAWAFVSGLLLGGAALTRPTMLYFILLLLPFLIFVIGSKGWLKSVLVVAGFLIAYGPWVLYTATQVPADNNSSLARDTVHKGMYANLIYQNDPETYGFPNRADPTWRERTTMGAVLDEVVRRVVDDPSTYVRWYLLGKPMMFLSWSIIVGMGDVWIYPLFVNPYDFDPLLRVTHGLMYLLHWPLVGMALLTCLFVWTPVVDSLLASSERLITRLISLVCLYFLCVHVVGTPLPRYSIPLRPIIFGMALLAPVMIWRWTHRRKTINDALD
ncbi:ArnT family glycosyltransferase [Thiorhodovibrio frisius]|uniref:Glycosyltransferase RgtA/B/C/D-like domain-containing protein n=1 Tax=Thiorhodovibrio frisius TaxID=631362 RepID=H8Z0V8_9GAMM|nr:glycosyltransferase family 39 protein [Thiorhodovibrio frisius]EIC21340.1 hypothetical protein Thi970DRAFT_01545 [Thiorhodovibrio frisius]WPL23924.1 hypothetical protein Thiofri_04133 [Thiorhodovibrio frisius]